MTLQYMSVQPNLVRILYFYDTNADGSHALFTTRFSKLWNAD